MNAFSDQRGFSDGFSISCEVTTLRAQIESGSTTRVHFFPNTYMRLLTHTNLLYNRSGSSFALPGGVTGILFPDGRFCEQTDRCAKSMKTNLEVWSGPGRIADRQAMSWRMTRSPSEKVLLPPTIAGTGTSHWQHTVGILRI